MADEGKTTEGMVVDQNFDLNSVPELNALSAKESAEQIDILLEYLMEGEESEEKNKKFTHAILTFKAFSGLEDSAIGEIIGVPGEDSVREYLNGYIPPLSAIISFLILMRNALEEYAMSNAN